MKPSVCVYGDATLAAAIRECLAFEQFTLRRLGEPADILWVAFDTPVDEAGVGHAEEVAERLHEAFPMVADNTLILISSQVPTGFTATVERDWRLVNPSLHFAYSPENLRVATAAGDFRQPARVVIGLGHETPREPLDELFKPFCHQILWMSIESAEFSKHALNGYLALTAAYVNELASIAVPLGVDVTDVEVALRSDPRIGRLAYVQARAEPLNEHMLRELHVLRTLSAQAIGQAPPIVDAVLASERMRSGVHA